MRLLRRREPRLVLLGDTQRQKAVARWQVAVRDRRCGGVGLSAQQLEASAPQKRIDAAHGHITLLGLVAAARHHAVHARASYEGGGGRQTVQRARNPWDRFYRYHEAPWRGERPVQELLGWLGDGPVLELGCGNGKLLRPLVEAGVNVVGLDISFHILSRIEASVPRVLADASALPFTDGAFTAVLDIHCTGHLGHIGRARAAAEAFRVLTPGGHLVVERLTPKDLRASQGQSIENEPGMRQVQDGRATHFAHADELNAAFTTAGFTALGAAVERKFPGHGGRQVTRESVRLLFEKNR